MIYQPPFHGEMKYLVRIKRNGMFPYHWHKEIELLWCISGGLRMDVEGRKINVGVGNAILINSAEEHSYEPISDDTEVLVIEVGEVMLGESFNLFVTHCYPEHIIDLADQKNEPILHLLTKMHGEVEETPTPEGRWLMRGYLLELFATVYRILPFRDVETDKQKRHLLYLKNIQPALDYVEKNFGGHVTVGKAADEASYERTSFCRVFRLATGVTFLQYLNNRRIDEAKLMLTTEQMSIQEIGERCGMPRAKTFSRVFRQYSGMTPSEYRKQYRV